MAQIIVSSGTTLATTQDPNEGFDVFVAPGGAIFVSDNNGILSDGNNMIVVGGTVSAQLNAIANLIGLIRVTVTPTGVVQSFGTNSAIATAGATTVFNQGYIGSNGGNALSFNMGDDTVVNSGTLEGNVVMSSGNDSFTQRGGVVYGTVEGGSGDDAFNIEAITAGTRTLTLDGGAGTDRIDFSSFGAAVWIDLDYAGVEAWTRDDQNLASSNSWRMVADTANLENIVGGAGADYLNGNAANNLFLLSTGGVDTIIGDGGSDTIAAAVSGYALWVDLTATGIEVWTQDQAAGVNLPGFTWRPVADLTSIENLTGTVGTDAFTGDGADNTFNTPTSFLTSSVYDTFFANGGSDTYNADAMAFALWIDLTNTVVEVWSQRLSQVEVPNATWYQVADLASVENLIGTNSADTLAGDSNANRIEGGKGADKLSGRGGADTFVFNLSAGEIQTTAQRDTITDFVAGTDKIAITGLVALPPIVIDATPVAPDTGATLLYNTITGVLVFDTNGSNAGNNTEIAIFSGAPALTQSDFIFI